MNIRSPESLAREARIIQSGKQELQDRVLGQYSPERAEAQLDYFVGIIPALLSSDFALPGEVVNALITRYQDAQDSEGRMPVYTEGLLSLIVNLIQAYYASPQDETITMRPQKPFFPPRRRGDTALTR